MEVKGPRPRQRSRKFWMKWLRTIRRAGPSNCRHLGKVHMEGKILETSLSEAPHWRLFSDKWRRMMFVCAIEVTYKSNMEYH